MKNSGIPAILRFLMFNRTMKESRYQKIASNKSCSSEKVTRGKCFQIFDILKNKRDIERLSFFSLIHFSSPRSVTAPEIFRVHSLGYQGRPWWIWVQSRKIFFVWDLEKFQNHRFSQNFLYFGGFSVITPPISVQSFWKFQDGFLPIWHIYTPNFRKIGSRGCVTEPLLCFFRFLAYNALVYGRIFVSKAVSERLWRHLSGSVFRFTVRSFSMT